ncbi:short-wave-sensitive opsin 1 isoform 2-T2 [Morphnus guianensis]
MMVEATTKRMKGLSPPVVSWGGDGGQGHPHHGDTLTPGSSPPHSIPGSGSPPDRLHGLRLLGGHPPQRHRPGRHRQVQEAEATPQLHLGEHLLQRLHLLHLQRLHRLRLQLPGLLRLRQAHVFLGGLCRGHRRAGDGVVLGLPGFRALHRHLQTLRQLPLQLQARPDGGGGHLGHRRRRRHPPVLRVEQVHARGAAVLLRPRLVHGGHQVQERVLHLVPLHLLLHHAPLPHHLLLLPAAQRPAGRGRAAAGVGHDAEGGAGGVPHGGGDGGLLLPLLRALRGPGHVYGEQPEPRPRPAPGHHPCLLLQERLRLQPHHLLLHEQTGAPGDTPGHLGDGDILGSPR